jgi:hypothetical protein
VLRADPSSREVWLWCVIVCDLATSKIRRPWLALGCCVRENIYLYTHTHTRTVVFRGKNEQLPTQLHTAAGTNKVRIWVQVAWARQGKLEDSRRKFLGCSALPLGSSSCSCPASLLLCRQSAAVHYLKTRDTRPALRLFIRFMTHRTTTTEPLSIYTHEPRAFVLREFPFFFFLSVPLHLFFLLSLLRSTYVKGDVERLRQSA